MWGATAKVDRLEVDKIVSIHAPRVGRDTLIEVPTSQTEGFNSRTPCGARRPDHIDLGKVTVFQFTHPVWGATIYGG